MKWFPPRRVEGPALRCEREPASPRSSRWARTGAPGSVFVASGKGGTGKTLVAAALATLLARRERALLLDADLGVGNAHILQDVSPRWSLADYVAERRALREVVCACRPRLDLLPGGSGFARLATLRPRELERLALGLAELERAYAAVVVDGAAGISEQTLAFAAAADLCLIVTTPDVTAMTDAYAFYKVLLHAAPGSRAALVVNRASGEDEAQSVAERLGAVAERYLGHAPRRLGWLPEDRAAFRCGQRRRPVVLGEPDSALSRSMIELAAAVERALAEAPAGGLGRRMSAALAARCE